MPSVTTVTGLTADRMIEMENATVVDGEVVGDNLHLITRDATVIDAGNVRGPQGTTGTPGTNGSGYFICTSSTRPVSPIEGYVIYETDTDLVRVWTGTRWRVQERVICTLASLPTGLGVNDEGVYAYCTDVNYGFTWNGSFWVIDNRIICTSTTRPIGQGTLGSADEGLRIYETDTDLEYVWSGSAWILKTGIPHSSVYNLQPSAAGTQNLNTSYINYVNSAQGGPAQTPAFTKRRGADTKLIVSLSTGRWYVTTATGNVVFSVRVNGVDYPICGSNPNTLTDCNTTGFVEINALAAGSYQVMVRVKDTSPTAVINYDPGSLLSVSITEVEV